MQPRHILLLGLGTFAALTMLALVYFRERIGHIDMAFQTFLILKSGALEIQSGRFGAAVTQFWPWAAQEMGLPLKGVMLAYSFGHVFWPMLCFLFCVGLRQWQWTMLILLGQTLMTTQTFWWLSEMPQGLPLLIALFAWLDAHNSLKTIRLWQWPLWFFGVVTAFYFHPMILWPAAFLCCFQFFSTQRFSGEKSDAQRWIWAITLLFLGITVWVKYFVLKLDWYDVQAMARAEAFGQLWPHWFDLQSQRDFLHWCLRDYYGLPLAYFAVLGHYFSQKNWFKLALTAISPLLYVFLVNVPHHESTHQFYMENLYLPLGLMVAVPLVFDVLPNRLSPQYQWFVLLAVVVIGLWRIGLAHRQWTDRLHWEQTQLQAGDPSQKWLVKEQPAHSNILKLPWASPYEFLLLSALDGPKNARCIIITDAPERYDSLLSKPDLFLGTFKNYPFQVLPKRYFDVQDTSGYKRGMMNVE